MVVQYGGFTILSSPFFVEGLLPFLLIFSLVFAVLQKSKILGDGKNQIDAMVALSIGLLVIAFGQAVGIILQMVAFMAIALVVMLVFMLLVGIMYKSGEFKLENWTKLIIGVIIFIAVVIAVLVYTGSWDWITDFVDSSSSNLWTNIFFIIIVIAAIAAVVFTGGKSSEGSDKGK